MSAQVTTSVGNYPVAPDTSTGAFFSANPQYDTKRYRDLLVNGARWETQAKKYAKVKSAYDSWAMKLSNQYDSDIKTWEAAYNSPYNQSQLLEGAGYNRNWLQGAAGSQVQAGNQIGYTPSDSIPVRNTGLDAFGQAAGLVLSGLEGFARVKDTLASSQLKEAQANRINELMPYDAVLRYFKALPQYNSWYGFDDPQDVHYFGTSPNAGITFQRPNMQGVGPQMQKQAYDAMVLMNDISTLKKTYFDFSNKEKKYINDNILPLRKELLDLEKDIMQHSKTAAEAEAAIAKKKKEIYDRFGEKTAQQAYIREWFNMGTQALRLGLDAFTGIGRLRLGKGALDLGNRRESNRELDQQYQWLGDYSDYSGDRSILSEFLFDNLGW